MTEDEYKEIMNVRSINKPKIVIAATLFTKDFTERTLLYGYNCDRKTHHVYLLNDFVRRYDNANKDEIYKKIDIFDNYEDLVPNKRLYPECCDYDFCKFLKERGVFLPFTTWGSIKRKPKTKFWADIV